MKPERRFRVVLGQPTNNGAVDRKEAIGTILADLPPPPPPPPPPPERAVYAIDNALPAVEGAPLSFPVRRTGDTSWAGAVRFRIEDRTTRPLRNYRGHDAIARFARGDRQAIATVATIATPGAQGNRALALRFVSAPTRSTIDPKHEAAIGTIVDAPDPVLTPSPTPSPGASPTATPRHASIVQQVHGHRPVLTDAAPEPPPQPRNWWQWLMAGGGAVLALIAALLVAAAALARAIFFPKPRLSCAFDPRAGVVGALAITTPDVTIDAAITSGAPRASAIAIEECDDE